MLFRVILVDFWIIECFKYVFRPILVEFRPKE
jgi:hypothetical protein